MQTNKSRLTNEQKQAHINAWKESRMSKRAYCVEHNIPYYTFCSWKQLQVSTPKQFVPIEITKTSSSVFAIIHYSQHITLELHQQVQATYLQQLIACK